MVILNFYTRKLTPWKYGCLKTYNKIGRLYALTISYMICEEFYKTERLCILNQSSPWGPNLENWSNRNKYKYVF